MKLKLWKSQNGKYISEFNLALNLFKIKKNNYCLHIQKYIASPLKPNHNLWGYKKKE